MGATFLIGIWEVIKNIWSKYWPYILAGILILCVVGYIAYLRSCISDITKDKEDLEKEYTEQAYEMALLRADISGQAKEISYYQKRISLLEELKEREVIREKHYHTQIENNKTIIERYDEDKNLLPIYCKIDAYFGATTDSRCTAE